MRRRILLAIVATTALASIVLTLPFAIVGARREHEQTVSELDLDAQQALIEVNRTGRFDPDGATFDEAEWNSQVGVYLPDGRLVAGEGPPTADAVTREVVFLTTNQRVDGRVVFAKPVVENGEKVAAIRVAEIQPVTRRRIIKFLLLLVAFDVGAVAFAGLVGWFVAARLARPVRELRDDAVRLGGGDFSITPRRSGVAEIDETADVLADTAHRLGETIRREREFTVNASHQLRTPITSLRVLLEGELVAPRPDPSDALHDALGDVDRLQSTVDTMLDVARGTPITRTELDAAAWGRELADRWASRDGSPTVAVDCNVGTTLRISRGVLDQIVDVLVTNAQQHGRGTVTVRAYDDGQRLVVDVADEGRLERDPADLFERHDPLASGHGVGLSLARSLAQGEGGRLVLHTVEPTTFRLSLPSYVGPPANP